MAKKITEQKPKPRQTNYEPKVKFEGTLEDMIGIAIKPIHNKKSSDK